MRALVVLAAVAFLLMFAVAKPQIGLLAWGWLTMMQPHQEAYGMGGLRLNLVVAVVTILAWLLSKESKKPPADATSALLIAFMAWMVVCQVFSLRPDYSWQYFDRFIRVMIFIFLCSVMLNTKARIHAMIWILCISIGYYSVSGGAFTLVTGGSFRVWGPPSTMISDNNHVGAAFVVILPLLNYLRLQTEAWWIRLGLLGAMGLTFFAILGTHSRGALLGLTAVAIVLWWRSRQRMMIAIIALPLLAGGITFMPEHWFERMDTIQHAEEDASFNSRLEVWHVAFKVALDNPVTGAGLRSIYLPSLSNIYTTEYSNARAVHSIYFEILSGMGFVGLTLFLSIISIAFLNSFRILRFTKNTPELQWAYDFSRMAQASLVGYCVSGAALSIEFWEGAWLILILLSRIGWEIATIRAMASAKEKLILPSSPAWEPSAFHDKQPTANMRNDRKSWK